MPRVVLTGVGGFIGHHCLEYFLEHTDWHIVGIDSFRHKGTVSRLDAVPNYDPQRVTILRHDLAVPIDRALENQILGRTFGCAGDCIDIIINMASDSAVERSVTDPVPCLRNNYDLAINMLEFARQVRPRIFYQISTDEVYGEAGEDAHVEWDVIMPSNPYCLLPGTMIITPVGPKCIEAFDPAVDLVVARSKAQVPLAGASRRKWEFDYTGPVFAVRTRTDSITCTPEHRFFTMRNSHASGGRKISEVRASELKPGDLLLSARYLPIPRENYSVEPSYARFLGYWLGDGSYSARSRYVRLADEKVTYLERYRELLAGVFGSSTKSNTGQFGNIHKHGTKNCWYLQFASEAQRSRIDLTDRRNVFQQAMRFDKQSLAEFIAGFFDAEAHYEYIDRKLVGVQVGQKRRDHLELVQFMLRRLGVVSCLRPTTKGQHRLTIRESKSLRRLVESVSCWKTKPDTEFRKPQRKGHSSRWLWQRVEAITELQYIGKVYDLEVDKCHNYVANYILVHNSASKAAQEAVAISYWRTYGVPVVITNTMNCHDIKTKALTPTGPKLAKELKQGDEVFVLDSSGTVRVEPINGIVIRQHNGEMVRVRHKKSSQLVTPDHRMLIQRPVGKSRRYGSYEYVPANYLSEINRARIPVAGKWHGHAVLGEVVPTSKFVEQEEPHPDAKRLPPSLRWDWLAEIAGWYVSEGCLAPGFISFGQKKEANRERISMLLRDVGLRATPAERAITTSSQALSLILREFGTLAPNKLPRWLKDLPSELLGVFFHAAVAGDGTSYSNKNGSMRYVYYTTSRQLATDMAEVGIKIGLSARISARKTWSPNKTKKSRSYVVGFRHNVCDVESRNITHEYYEGLVWCLTVPSGNFAIMRDGIVSFSGNCIGEGQDKEKFLPKLIWKVATGQEMEIYGEPGAIGSRFYLHAKNMADALVFLASRCPAKYLSSPRPDRYNVVGDVELDNLEVAQMIAEIMGLSLKYRLVPSESARPGYDRRYALNGKKMEAMGWRAPLPTTVAFEKIVQWTLANPQWVL